jgi:hypothetical protein
MISLKRLKTLPLPGLMAELIRRSNGNVITIHNTCTGKKIFMKYKLTLLLLLSSCFLLAQEIPRKSIEDSVLGWMKVYHFKGAAEGKTVDKKVYSAAQLSLCDSFANWIQASYTPKGGLGDVRRTVTGKPDDYHPNDPALPQSYGANAKIYWFLKYNSAGKMIPVNDLGSWWGIMANGVPHWEIRDISTPAQYYFTMPSFETAFDGEAAKKIHDLTKVAALKPYSSFWLKSIETGDGTDYVLLSKDNKSPFIKLTKGEYLQLLENAIPVVAATEKKKLQEREQGNQKNIIYFEKQIDDKNEKRFNCLKRTREKYKDRLNELALTNSQPGLNDLDNDRDVFSNGYLTDHESTSGRMPVYKIDAAMAELCKKDKPQWILIGWQFAPHDPVEKHLYESIINNFNFDYVYNFFFDQEKVKGQQYKPLRSPSYKEEVVITEASDVNKKNATDKKIHFFEDFSTTGIGTKPIGWSSRLNSDGKVCTITSLQGEPGNWVEIKGNELLTPLLVKKPLPQNFTLSFDLAVPKNFTWGAKSLKIALSKQKFDGTDEANFILSIRPGYSGSADGLAYVETKLPAGFASGSNFSAPGFSVNKDVNKISVSIIKDGEKMEVWVGKSKVAEYKKGVPADMLFNALSFTHGRSDGDTEKYFISNIKITNQQ